MFFFNYGFYSGVCHFLVAHPEFSVFISLSPETETILKEGLEGFLSIVLPHDQGKEMSAYLHLSSQAFVK